MEIKPKHIVLDGFKPESPWWWYSFADWLYELDNALDTVINLEHKADRSQPRSYILSLRTPILNERCQHNLSGSLELSDTELLFSLGDDVAGYYAEQYYQMRFLKHGGMLLMLPAMASQAEGEAQFKSLERDEGFYRIAGVALCQAHWNAMNIALGG